MGKQSTDGTDRVEIGMLYASGAGVTIGTALAYYAEPAFGWFGGALLVLLGVGGEVYQRTLRTDADHTGGDRG